MLMLDGGWVVAGMVVRVAHSIVAPCERDSMLKALGVGDGMSNRSAHKTRTSLEHHTGLGMEELLW